jgi:nitrogen PTS system EIIA component
MFKLSDVLERHHVIPGLNARDKTAVIDELARRAAIALKLNDADIRAALLARERLGSTGVGHGIAIPHARVEGLRQPFGMFARIEPPVDFAAIDGERADLVFLLLTPAQDGAAHLGALAAISRRLRDAKTTQAIRGADSARDMFSALACDGSA